MLGDKTFRLRTLFEDFLIRLDRPAGPPRPEQRALARRVILDLRFGVQAREPKPHALHRFNQRRMRCCFCKWPPRLGMVLP